jgi:hypothetical protein
MNQKLKDSTSRKKGKKSVIVVLFVKTEFLHLFSTTMSPYYRAACIFYLEGRLEQKRATKCDLPALSIVTSIGFLLSLLSFSIRPWSKNRIPNAGQRKKRPSVSL